MSNQKDTSSPPNYHNEIKCLMYSFGDAKYPIAASVALVECFTHTQIAEIVVKSLDVARSRGGRTVVIEDVLFLLRKNKDKLKNLLQHLFFKDMAKGIKSGEASTKEVEENDYSKNSRKTTGYSLDFLSQIDRSIVDSQEKSQAMIHRLELMDRVTADLDATEYMYYTRCRQVNFHKNSAKFTMWLGLDSLTEVKLKEDVIEVLGFLVHETIREIVELSLLVKEDMEHILLSPHVNYPRYHQPTLVGPIPPTSSQELSPSVSPAAAATSQEPEGRRRSSSSTTTTTMLEGEVTRSQAAKLRSKALQPYHIREALRRFSYKQGPLFPLSNHFSGSTFYKQSLCA